MSFDWSRFCDVAEELLEQAVRDGADVTMAVAHSHRQSLLLGLPSS